MPKCNMPPGNGPASVGQMVGRRQPAWSGPDHQNALPGLRRRDGQGPALLPREVAEEPLHGMNADRAIELRPVASGLAGMIADAPMHGRKRVVAQDRLPGLAVFASLRQVEPGLHVFAGRAGVIARREEVDIKGAVRADGSSTLFA